MFSYRPKSPLRALAVVCSPTFFRTTLLSLGLLLSSSVLSRAANSPPAPAPDSYTVTGRVLSVPAPGVLVNDRDPDGDALFVGGSTQPLPSHVNMVADGSFTFNTPDGFIGTVTFQYLLVDSHGASALGSVTIIVLPTPGRTYLGRNAYITYIAGDLPLILSCTHGGTLEPAEIPNRVCTSTGCNPGGVGFASDFATRDLTLAISDAIFILTGHRPHVVINELNRTKLDANREIVEAAQGNIFAEQAWNEFQGFIGNAKASIVENFTKGLFIDVHGEATTAIHWGYAIDGSVLKLSDADINANLAIVDVSSIKALARDVDISFADLLRGPNSLGGLVGAYGFPGLPSPALPDPGEEGYTTGNTINTRLNGSRFGGTISAIQMECNRSLRNTTQERARFGDALARALLFYFGRYYGINLSLPAHTLTVSNIISVSAPDPTASEPGADGGQLRLRRASPKGAITVNLAVGGTATPGVDYSALPATVHFATGQNEVNLSVSPRNDNVNEPTQTVALTVLSGSGYSLGTFNTASVDIRDDGDAPPTPQFIARTGSVEGNVAATVSFADVTLSASSDNGIRLPWHTTTGTATSSVACGPNVDYIATNTVVTFAPGITSRPIAVPICGDLLRESNESFGVEVGLPSGGTIGGNCVIGNDDLATGSFAFEPEDREEGTKSTLNHALTWIVPPGEVWRDLKTLDLRLRDGAEVVLWVHWDEAANTFSLCDNTEVGGANADRCTRAEQAGSAQTLETSLARLHMAQTGAVGSGPTGNSVTLNLALSFKPHADGRTFSLEVAATDDLGRQSGFTAAGELTIERDANSPGLGDVGPDGVAPAGDQVISADQRAAFRLDGAPSTPSRRMRVSFSLEGSESAQLDMFDVVGRRVAHRDIGQFGSGNHVIDLDPDNSLKSGIYLLRMTRGSESLTRRVVLVR
jgi:Big-like domain-containing protein/Calx-beta domain-containing protein